MTVKIKDVTDGFIKQIDALTTERDELVAQVEYLKSHFNELIEIAQRCDSWESFPQKPLDRALAALQSLPQQCLRDVQAEAGRAGFVAGARQAIENDISWYCHHLENCADEYAATARQGGAE